MAILASDHPKRGKLVLIANKKSYMSFFVWYHNRSPWMTLNGFMAVTLHYFTCVPTQPRRSVAEFMHESIVFCSNATCTML